MRTHTHLLARWFAVVLVAALTLSLRAQPPAGVPAAAPPPGVPSATAAPTTPNAVAANESPWFAYVVAGAASGLVLLVVCYPARNS